MNIVLFTRHFPQHLTLKLHPSLTLYTPYRKLKRQKPCTKVPRIKTSTHVFVGVLWAHTGAVRCGVDTDG